MSEPRKLNTGDAQRTVYHAGDAQRTIRTSGAAASSSQLEEARRRARMAAAESSRRSRQFTPVQPADVQRYQAARQAQNAQTAPRTIHQPVQHTAGSAQQAAPRQQAAPQQRTIHRSQTAQPAQQAAPQQRTVHRTQPAQQPVQRSAPRPVQPQPGEENLTMAQRQALALRRQAAAKQAASGARARVQHLDLRSAQGERAAYNIDGDAEYEARQAARAAKAAAAQQPVAEAARSGESSARSGSASTAAGRRSSGASAGGQPPKGPGKGRKGRGDDGSGKKGGKKKKKGTWWKVLLATLLVLVLIFGVTLALIMNALRPETGGNITFNQLLNTPKEFAGKEINILLVGIDRSTEDGSGEDSQSNDGMTDMIMWMHFNNETGEVKMLQIPRNIFVTTDASYSGNYQINAIAKTQGSNGYNNLNALCEEVSKELQVPIDGYVSIRLEKLVELVDILGGVYCYIPQDMSYKGSALEQGYRNLDGAAAEFLLRNRHSYANSDLGRLNTQRYFYAAMFAKLRSMTAWDIAKNLPFYLSMVDTSLSISDLISVAVSLMSVSSDKIMLAQVPVYMGGITYNSNDVVVVARQETADLLNTYYRENTGPVDASELQVVDNVLDISGVGASDPNVQFMAAINEQVNDAIAESGEDTSSEYVYDTPTAAPESDATSTEDGSDASSEDQAA